jgi:hypothetical protein
MKYPALGHSMPCTSCGSKKLRRFKGQIRIRYPGLEKADGPPVWVFPELVLCLDCDAALFTVPGAELRLSGKLLHYQKPEPDAPVAGDSGGRLNAFPGC